MRRGLQWLPRLAAPGAAAPGASAGTLAAAAAAAAASGTALPSAARPQDVQQPPHWQQQRWQSALPQPAYGSEDEQGGGSTQQRDHRRRLQEMQQSGSPGGPSTQQPPRRPAWPSAEEAAATLRLGSGGGCSSLSPSSFASSALPAPAGEPGTSNDSSSSSSTLDWREVVEAARASQLQLGGDQVLTDTFGRRHTYLRISLTERCNLRCLYCMPEEGVELTPGQQLLSTEEVLRLARLFVGAGVDKIRLTGGEPTLRSDLVELTRRLSSLPGIKAVGLTSNGLTLGRKLDALKDAGLSLLNISLDTLQPERFVAMTRRQGHERVMACIWKAVQLGFDPVKVNVVVMRGVNDDEVPAFVELTRHAPLNVRFIEYMPFDGNVWSDSKMVPFRELLGSVEERFGALERCPDPRGEVAKNYRVPGFQGSVSFITSMTKAFCADCNRLRVMADGNLKVCLFGANEVSLRDAMREGASDDDLRAIVSAAVDRKKAAHAGMFELAAAPNRAMVKIGG